MCQRSAPIPPQVDLEERSKVLASVLFLFLECACDFFLCWCLLLEVLLLVYTHTLVPIGQPVHFYAHSLVLFFFVVTVVVYC